MGRIQGIRRLFRLPSSSATVGREVDQEIAFHLEHRVADLMAQGLTRTAAEAEAARRFGDTESARAELIGIDGVRLRRERRADWRESAVRELRHAARGLWRSPGFAAAVVLMLGLGVGVNAAMFGLADRLLLSPPPHVVGGDRLVRVLVESTPRAEGTLSVTAVLPYADYLAQRSEVSGFAEVGAYSVPNQLALGRGPGATEAAVASATPGFFALLGVQPALGRFFSEAEGSEHDIAAVAVLGHSFWQSRFGGDEGVLGRTIEISNQPYTVIGVAPRAFHGVDPAPVEVWVPVGALAARMGAEWPRTRAMAWLSIVARLAPGASSEATAAEATAVYLAAPDYETRYAEDPTARVVLGSIIAARAPGAVFGTQQRSGRVAFWLLGVSTIVLVIACVNVANLLLARGLRRRREFGVRLAIGVSRGRLAWQVLAETLLLGLAGGALGLLLAHWAARAGGALLLPGLDADPGGGRRVLLFAGGAALLSVLVAGLLPALHAARSDVAGLLGGGARGTTYRRSPLRAGLVMLQATLSVLLLVGAGLFIRSLHNARSLPMGYEPEHVVLLDWQTGNLGWNASRLFEVYDRSLERVRTLPDVADAALAMNAPLWGANGAGIGIPGRDSVPRPAGMFGYMYNAVSPGFFRTFGTRLLHGRDFSDADRDGAQPVAIISESMAGLLWPGGDALGSCFVHLQGSNPPCREVVGIVESTRHRSVQDAPDVLFYLPLGQAPPFPMRVLAIRTRGEPVAAAAAVRSALHEMEAGLPHVRATLLQDRIEPQLLPWRLGATLFSAFGVLALLLATLGLYGVVAYDITQRRRELGVRVALGARGRNILRLVVGDAVRLAGAGIVAGLVIAVAAAPRVEVLLFDVSPRDRTVFGAVVVLLLAAAALAALVPGWRAAAVHPMEATRDEA